MIITTADLAAALVLLSLLEGFRRVADGQAVLSILNGEWRVGCGLRSIWLRTLRTLWVAPAQTRVSTLIGEAKAMPRPGAALDDIRALRRRLAEVEADGLKLRPLVTVQAAAIFGVAPLAALLGKTWAVYCALLLVMTLCIAITALSSERHGLRSLKYIYPPASLYLASDVSLERLKGYDLDAMAAALLPDHSVSVVLRRLFRERLFANEAHREGLLARAAQLCDWRGIPMDRILSPPKRPAPDHLSHCPRCEASYVIREGTCRDCGGVALVAY